MITHRTITWEAAQEMAIATGIQFEISGGSFLVSYTRNNITKCFESTILLIPTQSVRRKYKRKTQNYIEVVVCTVDLKICEIVTLTPRQFENHHWLAEEIGCSGGLMMTADEYDDLHLRAIEMAKTIPQITIISDPGWYSDGFAIGDKLISKSAEVDSLIRADTGITCEELGIDKKKPDSYWARQIADVAFNILRHGKIAALLSILCLSMLYEDIRDRNPRIIPRFVTIIHGITSNGKTTVTKKILLPFSDSTPVSAESTVVVMQRTLQSIFGRIVGIDDFPPSMPRSERIEKTEGVIRVCGDTSAQRQTYHDMKGGSAPISAMACITAEDFYPEEPSSIARTFSVPIGIGECNFDAINKLQDSVLPTFAYRFVEHYIRSSGIEQLDSGFEKHRINIRSSFGKALMPRIIDNLALIRSAWDLVVESLVLADAELSPQIEAYTAELEQFLAESTEFQCGVLAGQNEALVYLRELKRRIECGVISLVKLNSDRSNEYVATSNNSSDIFENESYVYVSIHLEEEIRAFLTKERKLASGRRKLRELLESQGFLVKGSPKYMSCRLTVNGEQRSYLKLNKTRVYDMFREFE